MRTRSDKLEFVISKRFCTDERMHFLDWRFWYRRHSDLFGERF